MVNNVNENLSELFDVDKVSYEIVEDEKTYDIVKDVSKDVVQEDADFARKNIKELIQKGNIAIDQLLEVAKQSEQPRAYEVASSLIKNLSDLNKDLLELQKRKNDLEPKSVTDSKNVNIDKAVFVGSTTELIKMIKQSKKEEN